MRPWREAKARLSGWFGPRAASLMGRARAVAGATSSRLSAVTGRMGRARAVAGATSSRLSAATAWVGRRAANAAALLSVVGLLAVGLVTYSLIQNPIPLPGRAQASSSASTKPLTDLYPTATPSKAVTGGPVVAVPGSIAYAKAGEIYVQAGTHVVQITKSADGSKASDPAWSRDGQWVYYVDTRLTKGAWYNPNGGGTDVFLLTYPVLCRVHPDGSGQQDVRSGLIEKRKLRTFFWIRQPSISPDGTTAAVISDGPYEPGVSDTVLSFIDLRNGSFLNTPALHNIHPFGHSDPEYSPDGKQVAFVVEARNGNAGYPSVRVYGIATRTAKWLANGYRNPSWSPDGKYLAVTKSGSTRPDIAILDASTGAVIGQITADGQSWGPVWSPAGDSIIYKHTSGNAAVLRMVHVSILSGHVAYYGEPNLIDYNGLDVGSAVAWYIPGVAEPVPSPSATG
jgi:Tol biopolymer transport system component